MPSLLVEAGLFVYNYTEETNMNIKKKRLSYNAIISEEMRLDNIEREKEIEIRENLAKYKDRDAPIPLFNLEEPIKNTIKTYKKPYTRLVDKKCPDTHK